MLPCSSLALSWPEQERLCRHAQSFPRQVLQGVSVFIDPFCGHAFDEFSGPQWALIASHHKAAH